MSLGAVDVSPGLSLASATDWLVESPEGGGPLTISGGVSARFGPAEVSIHGHLVDREELSRSVGCAVAVSDADLVLAAYRAKGLGALRQLRGCFVIAISDPARDVFTVVRDPIGLHPLFYAVRGRSVLFGIHQKALIRQPGVAAGFNIPALADHLSWRWPVADETFFASVKRVLPGSRAILTKGVLSFDAYWDPAPSAAELDWLTTPEEVDFEARLDRAVDRCLEAGAAGIFLSGGLDSISVAAVATDRLAAANRPKPWALSLGFPDPSCDERPIQSSVARDLGLPQHLMNFWDAVSPRGLLQDGLLLNEWLGSPLLNLWGPAYLRLAGVGSESGLKTILTGSGGDEWLTVSPLLSADLIRRGDFAGLARMFAAWRRSHTASTVAFGRNVCWRFGLRPLMSAAAHRIAPRAWDRNRSHRATLRDPKWVAPGAALRAEQRERAERALPPADPPGGYYLREVAEGLRHTFVSWELEEQYEFGQRVGVSFQHPYWDPDLIDVLYRSAPALLVEGGRTKSLVRQTLARRFPNLGFERQKKLAATTFFKAAAGLEGPKAFAAIGGDFGALADLGVVDRAAAVEAAAGSLNPSSPELKRALAAINLESWVRVHG